MADNWPGTSGLHAASSQRSTDWPPTTTKEKPMSTAVEIICGDLVTCRWQDTPHVYMADSCQDVVRIPAKAAPLNGGMRPASARATTLANDSAGRKRQPVASGVLDYFPDAIVAVAEVSQVGNDQHNPGQPLHWDRAKSTDEADTMLRHFLQRGSRDTDGLRHTAKMAWRALALLQKEIEAEHGQ